MDNLSLYNKYRTVPANALKPFDNGNFKGTDINTMWRIKCLTEEFGICGVGWYPELVNKWTEQGANGEIMCFVEIKLYIKVNGEWSKGISATGGSKLIYFVKPRDGREGYFKNSDEGYKMAKTDALGVACKYLGFGADVYWDNDKTKYTQSSYEQEKPTQRATAVKNTPEPKTDNPSDKPLEWTLEELTEARDYAFENGKKTGIPFSEYDERELQVVIENIKTPLIARYAKIVLASRLDDNELPF